MFGSSVCTGYCSLKCVANRPEHTDEPTLSYTYDMSFYEWYNSRATYSVGGRTGLMVRASDSGSGDPGSILGRVGVFVSLSKRHLLPKSTGNTQE